MIRLSSLIAIGLFAISTLAQTEIKTYTPPGRTGTIYIVSGFKTARPVTKITVRWGSFSRTEDYGRIDWQHPLQTKAGFVIRLQHTRPDSIPLIVESEGKILLVEQLDAPPSQWTNSLYSRKIWGSCDDDDSLLANLNEFAERPTSKPPLILVHGIHGTERKGSVTSRVETYWTDFVTKKWNERSTGLSDKYELFVFKYCSDRRTVDDIAEILAAEIEQKLGGRRPVIVAHSMGGLVAKSYMAFKGGGPRVERLITLGTPHHGTPGANSRRATNPYRTDGRWWAIKIRFSRGYYWWDSDHSDEVFIDSNDPNRSDLRWDNFDQSFNDPKSLPDINTSLIEANVEFARYSSILTAYAGILEPNDRGLNSAIFANDHERLEVANNILHDGFSGRFGKTDGMVPLRSGLFCRAKDSNFQSEPNGVCDSVARVRRFEPGTGGEVPAIDLPSNTLSITRSSKNGRGYDHLDMFTHPDVLNWLVCDLGGPCPKQPAGIPTDPSPVLVPAIPTLFLFDVSGSMKENNKIGQAREAGLDALKEMDDGGAGSVPVSIMSFGGPCSPASVRMEHPFTKGTSAAWPVMGRIAATDGATPLPQAKSVAEERMLVQLQTSLTEREGRVLLLSDGQSTCGAIRPPGVFSREVFTVTSAGMTPVKFFTIGFDVPPGSAAERDLQYLAAKSGGRYYNAADRDGLARALRKHVRVYRPRACNMTNPDFAAGIKAFTERDFPAALEAFRRYVGQNPADWCGQYNLALALEANDRYKRAGETYSKYLSLVPSSPDRSKIETKIADMRAEYAALLDYQIRLIQSDHDYLRGPFWRSIFNNESSQVAAEFGGFVYEKGEFYANLPDILEIDERWLLNDSKNISSSFRVLDRRRKQPTFDQDAVSLLTTPVGQIEDMLERLRTHRSTAVR